MGTTKPRASRSYSQWHRGNGGVVQLYLCGRDGSLVYCRYVIDFKCILENPEEFYKGGSQEKTHVLRPEFFLLPSPHDRARSVLNCRAMDSGAGHCGPVVWIFSTSGFHRLFATKPVSSETSKAERWSGANHGSIGDSWPIAFSGCPRGPRVVCETGCPRHILSNFSAETRSRTRVSQEPDGHRQRRSPGWNGLGLKHSSCLWFQKLGVEAHSSLPYDQHDGGNFPSQGQARHLRPHPLGQQGRVELLQRTGLGRGDDRRTLE